jgi:adenylate cyclase
MKRALFSTLWIGALAAGAGIGPQLAGVLVRPNTRAALLLGQMPNDSITFGYVVFLLLLSFAFAWTMCQVVDPWRRAALFLLLVAELTGAAWLLARLGITFPLLPALIVAFVTTLLAVLAGFTQSARQRRSTLRLFGARLGPEGQARVIKGKVPDFSEPLVREASFVFCEIANAADLIEDLAPAECAAITREFIDLGSKYFLKTGGYLHAADGEGIRVLFGFPDKVDSHAVEAAHAALAFDVKFREIAASKSELLDKIDLRIGVSSGSVVATVRDEGASREIVLAGEPFEIGRRIARANRTYGTRILLGPRTFNAAGKAILARPIDFLRNTEEHERLEVYELLGLSEKMTPEQIARRDRFWTAVVYFRARRWKEAMAEFNRARGDNGEVDLPLQWYLRRLEPLCLQMATEPKPAVEPMAPLW